MSHFAEVDEKGTVLRVIVAEQDFIDSGVVGDPKRWIQTYPDGSLRGCFAGKGYTYDKSLDQFKATASDDAPLISGNLTISVF